MSSHADTIRSFFMDRYGTDSYKVNQRTLAAIPGSHQRNPPRPHTSAGRALAALDALLVENQRLREKAQRLLTALKTYGEGNFAEADDLREALAGDAE